MTKIAQSSPQQPPSTLPKTPKSPFCCQNAIVVLTFTSRPFLQRSPPRPPKIAKTAPPTWPDKPHLAAILAIPRLSKICQNRPRQLPRRFSCQGRFQDLPDPLQTSIFMVFGTIFKHIFVNFLKTFCEDSVSNSNASLKISLRIFFHFLWERSSRKVPKGGGRRYAPAGRLRSAAPA